MNAQLNSNWSGVFSAALLESCAIATLALQTREAPRAWAEALLARLGQTSSAQPRRSDRVEGSAEEVFEVVEGACECGPAGLMECAAGLLADLWDSDRVQTPGSTSLICAKVILFFLLISFSYLPSSALSPSSAISSLHTYRFRWSCRTA